MNKNTPNTNDTTTNDQQNTDTSSQPDKQQAALDEEKIRSIVSDAIREHLESITRQSPEQSDHQQDEQDDQVDPDVLNLLPEKERQVVETALRTMPRLAEDFARMQSEFQTERQVRKLLTERKELREYEDEFRSFLERDENRSKPVDLLADRFLLQKMQERQHEPKPGVEQGTPGAAQRHKDGVYTAEELREIRLRDPKRYMQLIAEGKVKDVEGDI